jgi:hypothetical protein
MSYSQTIIEYLRRNSDKWFASHELQQKWLDGKWVGSSGARRARELAEEGKIEVRHNGKYAEYHAFGPKTITEYRLPTGELIHKKYEY